MPAPAAFARQVSKKLLNEPTDAVSEMIDGIIATNCCLNRIAGYNVVVRHDADAKRDDQVAVISGGGSGHEPSHGGWVGAGMLNAAVAGDIFASPSAASVLAAIMTVTGEPGCLVIIKNYTGDRLNFGLAVAQARAAGRLVELVVVGDDCALPAADKLASKRRGLAGTVLVHKVAGAAAASGLPLATVAEEARRAAAAVGTMGLSLTSCTLPGQLSLQRIPAGQVEIGLGIHGEPGAATIALSHVDELVDRLLEQIMSPEEGYRFMTLSKGERVCLLVNNLGATTLMELSIVARRAISHLEERYGVHVVRVYCGTFMSSLDMAGVSLSVMQLDELRIARLDAMTRAPCWPSASAVRREKRPPVACVKTLSPKAARAIGRPTDPRLVERAIRAACARVQACHGQLNEWDRLVGDGDCGETLNAGACAVLAAIDGLADAERAAELSDAAAVLRLVGRATSRMGGSSGALYHIGLTAAAAEAVQRAREPNEGAMWAAAMRAGIASIAECGGARVGHRTMLDALVPASDALTTSVSTGLTAAECLDQAIGAAAAGAESTKGMRASAGRSAYVPEAAQIGVPDPGAMGVVEWMLGLRQALGEARP